MRFALCLLAATGAAEALASGVGGAPYNASSKLCE